MTIAPSDPFADHTPRGEAGCVCGGGGMIFVDEDYVARHATAAMDGAHLTPGALEALRWSVFPCHECRPDQYNAWAQGQFSGGNTSGRRRRSKRGRHG